MHNEKICKVCWLKDYKKHIPYNIHKKNLDKAKGKK